MEDLNFANFCKIWLSPIKTMKAFRLDSNIESKSTNNTYLNFIEIFYKIFKKMNIIEMQTLVGTLAQKKGNFNYTGKIMSLAQKTKCRSGFD